MQIGGPAWLSGYCAGSSWSRDPDAPEGMLFAVSRSVAPLGASLCSDLPARERKGEDSLSLADATSRGALGTLPAALESLGPFPTTDAAIQALKQISGSLLPSPSPNATCSQPRQSPYPSPGLSAPTANTLGHQPSTPGHSRGSESGVKQQGGPNSVQLGQCQLPVLGRDPWVGLGLDPG